MENSDSGKEHVPFGSILKNLEDIRKRLVEISAKQGDTVSYHVMKHEIQAIGWSGIVAKYHPDINIDHPAPCALFELYRFVYNSMDRDSR